MSQGSTQTAVTKADAGEARVFPCQSCGAELVFNIGQQNLACPYCGFVKELQFPTDAAPAEQDYEEMLAKLAERRVHGQPIPAGTTEVRCTSCGAKVIFAGTLTSSECAYCGSPIQRENVHESTERVPVDAVLPFAVEREKAAENLKHWVQSRWFAPTEFRKRGVDGRFNGVYVPYWTFDSLTFNAYQGQRGEHYYVTVGSGKDEHQEQRTNWWPVSGSFQLFFDDVLTPAAANLPEKVMIALEPWPLTKCRAFHPEFLAGFQARTYDVELDQGFVHAKSRMDSAIHSEVISRIGGDEQMVSGIQTQYTALKFKHLLLPVWLLAYRYHDKPYLVAVNAGTGEVQGQRPYSWLKITFAILSAVASAAAAYYFGSH